MSGFVHIPMKNIGPSATNPRKHWDTAELDELAESIRQHGVLQPILVRERGAGFHEIISGERRYRASKIAGRETIPAIVTELDDVAVLEIQIIENMQRADLHPLEEAAGYRALLDSAPLYTPARIGEKVGRSARYIYDRLRLLDLIDPAQELFRAGTITAGHAVLLSRLSQADQERAVGTTEGFDGYMGALFTEERDLFLTPDEASGDAPRRLKPVSVRELAAWIDRNVRLAPDEPDLPELFPAAAAAVEEAPKVVLITRGNYVPPEARAGAKILGPRLWRRADGQPDVNDPESWKFKGYKPATCEHAVTGFVAVGQGRGEAFAVCVAKQKCKTHWRDAIKEAAARAEAKTNPEAAEKAHAKAREEEERWARERAEEKRLDEIWKRARNEIVAATKEAVHGASIERVLDVMCPRENLKRATIKTPEQFVRAMLAGECEHQLRWQPWRRFPEIAKALGIDLKAILAKHAETEAKPKAEKKPAAKKKTPSR